LFAQSGQVRDVPSVFNRPPFAADEALAAKNQWSLP